MFQRNMFLYKFDNEGNVTNADEIIGMHSIEKSLDMLRKTEKWSEYAACRR